MKMNRIYKHLPFTHPSQAVLDSIITLREFSAGKGSAASALAALRHLENTYGHPVRSSVSLFKRGLDNSNARHEILFEALNQIIDWIFRNRIKAAMWERSLRGWNALAEKLRSFTWDRIPCPA
jgi:hypothetical protein